MSQLSRPSLALIPPQLPIFQPQARNTTTPPCIPISMSHVPDAPTIHPHTPQPNSNPNHPFPSPKRNVPCPNCPNCLNQSINLLTHPSSTLPPQRDTIDNNNAM